MILGYRPSLFHSLTLLAVLLLACQGCLGCLEDCTIVDPTTTTAPTSTPEAGPPSLRVKSAAPPSPEEPEDSSKPSVIPKGLCGTNKYMVSGRSGRIVGGFRTRKHEIPWQVRLEISKNHDTFLCGGTIIDKSYVVTAAHCAIKGYSIKVQAGGWEISAEANDARAERRVDDVHIHGRYNNRTMAYDVAILHLRRPLSFSDAIQPICLARSCSKDCSPGDTAVISGWGTRSDSSRKASSFLQKGLVDIVSKETCQAGFDKYNIQRRVLNRMVCAGDEIDGTDTCRGDNGGPLACIPPDGGGRYHLTGVKSTSDRCGAVDLFSVYTKSCSIIRWINGIIEAPGDDSPTPPRPPRTTTTRFEWTDDPWSTTERTTRRRRTTTRETTTTRRRTTTTRRKTTTSGEPEIIPMETGPGLVTESLPTTAEWEELATTQPTRKPSDFAWKYNNDTCGKRNGPTSRIVNGTNAQPNEFPWQVRFEIDGALCGGSLITDQWVVTAAHCIDPKDIGDALATVILGSHIMSVSDPGEQRIEAELMLPHPYYDEETHEDDIALIKLSRPVVFTDKIQPVCLFDRETCSAEAYERDTCSITGWGATFENAGVPSNILQKAEVPIIDAVQCEDSLKNNGKNDMILEGKVCAGLLRGGTDSCQGDSGGPLACIDPSSNDELYYLNGVVSYGYGCARAGLPGIYTRVCHYMYWITDTIETGEASRMGRRAPRRRRQNRPNRRRSSGRDQSRRRRVIQRRRPN